ncbi:MAG: hypothetical protein PUB21_09635 [Bacteroidales bacterium]|nr:hypothetical protein [Bacteroidales bacterium]
MFHSVFTLTETQPRSIVWNKALGVNAGQASSNRAYADKVVSFISGKNRRRTIKGLSGQNKTHGQNEERREHSDIDIN